MKRQTHRILISLAILFMFTVTACGLIPSAPSVDTAATAVSATMSSFASTATASAITPGDHSVPTATDLPATPQPLGVKRAALVSSDGSLWVWTDGTPAMVQLPGITLAERCFVSPDGALIAFTRKLSEEAYELAVVNADGSNLRTLVTADQFNAMPHPADSLAVIPNQVAWIPGGHEIAFNTRVQFMGPGLAVGPDLQTINADTGAMTPILNEDTTWQFWYSPNGSRIVITLPDGINLYNSNGSLAAPSKFLTYPLVNTASEYQWTARAVWKMDGSAFAIYYPPAEPFADAPGMSEVKVVSADGSTITSKLSSQIMFQPSPMISPDLSKIIYLKKTEGMTNVFEYHLAFLETGLDVIYAANSYVTQSTWSPDSQHFLYAVNNDGVNTAIIGTPDAVPVVVPGITSARDLHWLDANRYLVLDAAATGWKVWLGTLGTPPTIIYTDSLGTNMNYALDVN